MLRRDDEMAYLALEIAMMSELEGRTYWKLGAAGSKDGKDMDCVTTAEGKESEH